ncbi:MAG: YgiQ family radical SAM protein [Pseudodesulfovibrio sp.]|uniref:Radical SAM domain protein n=1 Tax=Pseudodesulfovibrio aespoeensis (strain ATCC 700646 / DSM 10631 / Aspo-2) TaxID=643562 RepID=E6VT04_PSEA9|nr:MULTISPECIES: YgiQ family radical SAM protein [Pseudodesulfovibrio]MBU4191024.1 YgiQ family radical SAM protein [Pseudomonadota bacterium]ADU62054.1 Radical SAM domain protein [Pseudodesulfovibrio aespoeensis Aspo-2]MBU4243704.1 YgiQ family radical SAM protein [Pseudomonadota bacterium]MBU4378894.1 YgiQ family radical SAM protein [Pseudomonadota bacterium]MBU4474697.1 YgiQ family radical SAM protein [Pseudomonadota bacterium]
MTPADPLRRPRTAIAQPLVLPMTRQEMDRLGWDELDILLITGDGYVDHPSFGAALLGRWLIHHGYRVGVVAQPRWDTPDDVVRMGRPRLFAGVTAGSLDSMLAHYTAFRKKRSDDAYTPGGMAGSRPNRACIAYANVVQRAFRSLPVILGGIEASLRRISHYDFWADSVRRSILLDSKATAITYGMAENSIVALADAIADAFDNAEDMDLKTLRPLLARIPGVVTAGASGDVPDFAPVMELPSHEDILADPQALIRATLLLERQVHQNREIAVQQSGDRLVILTPPGPPLDTRGLDKLAGLPFTRLPHPAYAERIPAADMIMTSITTHRGCAGGCSFCTLALHQGRQIRSRSRASLLREAEAVTRVRGFGGSISDVGGPSANMWGGRCASDQSACVRASCLTPAVCKHFTVSQSDFLDLLDGVAAVPSVKHVRVASGWRMDLALTDMPPLARLIRTYVGGQAKVAPENMAEHVLKLMRKPTFDTFERFLDVFERESKIAGKRQYVIPYLMSAFPGCTDDDMRALGQWLRDRGWKPEQVQCFIPLPGTAAAAMYHAGTDLKGNPIPVAKTDAERLRQHGLLMPTTGRPGPGKSGGKSRPGQKKHS